MLFEQMTVFTVSVAVRSSAFCTVKIASTLILGAKMPLRSDSFCNMGGGDEVWSCCTSAGLKQAFRPLLEQERISWWAWKMLTYHMFWARNILLKDERHVFPAADKESHLAEVDLGANLGDTVLHLRDRVHQEVVAAPGCNGIFLFLCDSVLSGTCPPIKCGSAGCWLFFSWPEQQLFVLEHSMCRHYLKSSLFAKTSRDSWAKICHCKKVTIIDLCNQNGR